MGKYNIGLLGDAALSERLRNLPDILERTVLKEALQIGAQAILHDAKRRAPRGKTGLLEAGLHVRPLKRKRGRVGFMVRTGTREQMGIGPHERGYYPAHVELGHAVGRRQSRRALVKALVRLEFGTRMVPPHPYLRPALIENQGTILEILRQELRWRLEDELR